MLNSDEETYIIFEHCEIEANIVLCSTNCPCDLLWWNAGSLVPLQLQVHWCTIVHVDVHLCNIHGHNNSEIYLMLEYTMYVQVHPIKSASNGIPVVISPLILYSDDFSGNRSKKWNKFDAWLFQWWKQENFKIYILYPVRITFLQWIWLKLL